MEGYMGWKVCGKVDEGNVMKIVKEGKPRREKRWRKERGKLLQKDKLRFIKGKAG